MLSSAYQQYQNNAVMTANQGELTLMLYNGAIKFCNLAIEAMDKKNMVQANVNILKAQAIVNELQCTLDMKYAIAEEMNTLYTFIKQLLIETNIQKDAQKAIEARELIREFRDTWQMILKR